MLIRADPETKSISMLSFPRDLIVDVYCPGSHAGPRPHQLGLLALRHEGHARDRPQADGHPDPVPDHGQLPRLPADRRQARRRLARHRPPLLQQERRPGVDRLLRHRPAARLPAAERRQRARVRPLPPHRRRLPPARAPAGVRAGVQGSGRAGPGPTSQDAPDHQGDHAERRGRLEEGLRRAAPCSSTRCSRRRCRAGTSSRSKIDGVTGYAELTAPDGAIANAVQQFENPDVGVSKVANNAALGRKPKAPKTPAPKDTTVTVLNGSGIEGAAATASTCSPSAATSRCCRPATRCRTRRPRTTSTRRSTSTRPRRTPRPRRCAEEARRAADVKPLPKDPALRALDPGAKLLFVAGQTFHNTIGDGADGRDAEAAAAERHLRRRHRARPRRGVPRQGAVQADGADRARALVGARPGLRRHAQAALQDRQGPQGDPPRLPHRRQRVLGRARRPTGTTRPCWPTAASGTGSRAATTTSTTRASTCTWSCCGRAGRRYWVVNTLLDSLSNETMIAIAKGLKPLGPAK